MTAREDYERFLRSRHRPAHARRAAATTAKFFLPSVKAGDRVLDLGCGPGSITLGFADAAGPAGVAVGVDLDPGPSAAPMVRGDVHRLPFADGAFDAVFAHTLLQHLADPLPVLQEARRTCRPGGVIAVADLDMGGVIREPDDPWLVRGHEITLALRAGSSPFVGRRLRGLLHDAGFVDIVVEVKGVFGGSARATVEAEFEARAFEAPEVVAYCAEQSIATASEMASVAEAWRRWGAHPGATRAGHWFEALARAPE